MRVPLTVNDFIERAELVYGDRVGVVDEPDQPAESWGSATWREIARACPRAGRRASTRSVSGAVSASRSCRTTRRACSRRSSA